MKNKINFTLIGAALITSFYPMFLWMIGRFEEPDSYYSHGYLIPLVTVVLIWNKRNELSKLELSPSNAGLILIIAGILMYLIGGIVFKIGFISGFSFVATLFGLSLFLFGKQITKAISFPLFFLLFMVPMPKVLLIGITFKMKMMAAFAAVSIVSAMNLTIERAGSIIYLPNGILTIDNECSGINSLISLVTLSILFAYVAGKTWLKKSVFIICSFPIALTANIARIVFLIVAAYIYGVDAAINSPLHYGSGIIVWVVALIMLSMLWRLMQWEKNSQETSS